MKVNFVLDVDVRKGRLEEVARSVLEDYVEKKRRGAIEWGEPYDSFDSYVYCQPVSVDMRIRDIPNFLRLLSEYLEKSVCFAFNIPHRMVFIREES